MVLTISTALPDALIADGPAPDRAEAMGLYGWLIGSWDIEVFDHLPDGTTRRSLGEWHFAWALEGRAIQDVFIVPSRAERRAAAGPEGNRYGTTLRVYDPQLGAWHILWVNPVRQAIDRMIGRRRGNDIVQEGEDKNGQAIRWSFVDIAPDSFRWLGERSTDGGQGWRLEVEFRARRTAV